MLLSTTHFGSIEIDEKNIIFFPEGIPGFQDIRKLVLLEGNEENYPFQWIQAVDDMGLAFVVVDPKVFKPDYLVDIDDSEVEMLDIGDIDKIVVLSIVVVPDDVTKITANLKAPILINTQNNRGKQVILNNSEYNIKHYIIEELRRIGGLK